MHDAVGNVTEWVADWLPLGVAPDVGWGAASDDLALLRFVSPSFGIAPLFRGGGFAETTKAGPLDAGAVQPALATFRDLGFRCAR